MTEEKPEVIGQKKLYCHRCKMSWWKRNPDGPDPKVCAICHNSNWKTPKPVPKYKRDRGLKDV